MQDAAIEIDGVVKTFIAGEERVVALRRLTACITRGHVTGLVGPDGAGKTTLLRLTAGLLAPDEGTIRVLGLDAARQAEAVHARLGYMPQRFGLYEDLSVDENLALYADLQGLPGAARDARFRELMAFTGLGAFGARLAGRLSGGMKQKLGLACTLVQPPEILLLDEPSVGVDPLSRRELWQIVRRLAAEGMTVVWSTAYQDEAERCDQVVVLHEGRLLGQDAPANFLAPVRGRTFSLQTRPAERREVVQRAKARPEVLDAVIQGRTVRLLLARGASAPPLSALLPERNGSELAAVEPRFEDAFIALLREGGDAAAAAPASPAAPRSAAATVRRGRRAAAAGAAAEPVIQIEDLTRVFGDFRAVDAISFSVVRGEIFGLLGPNGAGKSTTFKMLCGLLPPTTGTARVLGIDLRRAAPAARARIGYMSQRFALYGVLSVRQNLGFFASAYGLAGHRHERRISALLDEFALRALADRTSEDLPLGYKQRLSLACALLHEPEILFLDEPTSGVDPLTRREFWARINAMADAGVTVMVTTHFLDEAEYCDRLGIVYRGKLIAVGAPDALKEGARRPDVPEPTLDDAFVELIEAHDRAHPQ